MTPTNEIPEELRHITPGFDGEQPGSASIPALDTIRATDLCATEMRALSERDQAEHDLRMAWARFSDITYQINVDKGFFAPGKEVLIGDQISLIHSEISEGYEAWRKGLNDDKIVSRPGLEVELADAVIRIMNLGRHLGFDVATAIVEKTRYNETRPYMHGGKKC